MTVKGRISKPWGRTGARWDSHAENGYRTRSYPALPDVQIPDVPEPKYAELPGRPGAAERTVVLGHGYKEGAMRFDIATSGWYPTHISLDERQAHFLRDTLNAWFPAD